MVVKKASSRVAAEKKQKAASPAAVRELSPRPGTPLAALLREEFPEIAVQEKFGSLSFSVGKKVVGFTRGEDAVALKLPAGRVRELAEKRGWDPLVMGKRVMKEWVVVERGSNGWKGELKLFREALEFVGG
jgi:hypothetical protein